MSEKSFRFDGVRAVAVFESLKAILILVVGFGLLSLINTDIQDDASWLVKHLHLNPASKYPQIFIKAVSHVDNSQLWGLAALAFFDAVVRGVEGVGLWLERTWAKWLTVVTAAIYIPIEVYEMYRHLTWLKTAMFVANVIIVVYLCYSIYVSDQSSNQAKNKESYLASDGER